MLISIKIFFFNLTVIVCHATLLKYFFSFGKSCNQFNSLSMYQKMRSISAIELNEIEFVWLTFFYSVWKANNHDDDDDVCKHKHTFFIHFVRYDTLAIA